MSRVLARLASPDGEVVRVLDDDVVLGEVRARGAQVTRWRPRGREEVVFTGVRQHDPRDRVVHGGVPVCFPWFGGGPGGDLVPSHGPARIVAWEELGCDLVDDTLVTRWSLGPTQLRGADGAGRVPVGLMATLVTRLGPEDLHVTLEAACTGVEAVTVEMALHTYLRVGDVARVRIEGLAGSTYVDKVASAAAGETVRRRQDGDLVVAGEVDQVHGSTGSVQVHDPVLDRTIQVDKSGSRTTVVWNPGEAKGTAFADLAPGEWRRFVCVEAANTADDAVTLAPGASHAISQWVSLR